METVEAKALNEIEKQQKEAGITFLGVIQFMVDELNSVKTALEKQIAKKPDIPWDTQIEQCPVCQRSFIGKPNYCSECGQKIDWSETEKGGASDDR